MNISRVDSFARLLTASPSRRAIVRSAAGLALGGMLGSAGLGSADAKGCGPCIVTKRGRCTKDRPDGSRCRGDGRCLNGRCNPAPTCKGFGTSCFFHVECCGGSCRADQTCDSSADRGVCRAAGDCTVVCHAGGSCDSPFDCVGYRRLPRIP